MNLIAEWVMQIIVFILIGTIMELLIPNNSMKKYVHIVIGLLLLLILAKPILYLFSVDVTTELKKIEQTIFQDQHALTESKNLLENQKREIQAEQDAYIWNEVKTQLMNEANPVLSEQYSAQIVHISFDLRDEELDKDDNLEKIIVTLTNENELNDQSVIKPIIIETEQERKSHEENNQIRSIRKKLEQIWEFDKDQIEIIWEGGAT
ncbi:stage III sporulation protein AF [Pseudogracilibacillus auburnensis]|uniref:Stage III sporulation protein AF n=1 Tax=Pseudogracilibacillus auburnensis TaxID=1494959 RepID=A0A2V3VTH3_9BACI|nr:stage III sporulation protein AF [Pseudogracilibacillus auburnensis]PXW85046.1 stage III sporulation protein AF [Pseudogracilibacillus auburnensis]